MIIRKAAAQVSYMRSAGRVVAEILEKVRDAARPGVSTAHLDQVARGVLAERGARSNFLNYHGFPATICTSPNDVIVHGIPRPDVVLAEGDVLSIDAGAIIEGWHGDAAATFPIGDVDEESVRLMDVTGRALDEALKQAVEGNRLGDIGWAVESVCNDAGFGLVREYVGHGIGTAMHEEPQIPNYGPPGKGVKIRAGHVFAIEPMINAGTGATRLLDDGWTVVTADGRRSAHFEHTVAVTEDGPEVLTLP